MKQFIILFIATVITTSLVAQKATLQTQAQEWKLKGKVKSINESVFEMTDVNGKSEKGELIYNTLYDFDKEGNLITQTAYSTGIVEQIWKFKHAKPGQTTEAVLYNKNNKLMQKTNYKYNENDFEISRTEYDSVGKISDQYNIEVISINELKYVTIRNGDDGKRKYTVTDTVALMPNGRIKYTTKVAFGDFTRTQYYYDRVGNINRYISEKKNGDKTQSDMEYDEAGNLKRFTYGKLPANATRGALPVIESEETYQYTPDLQGNWTKTVRVNPYDSWFNSLKERVIEYY